MSESDHAAVPRSGRTRVAVAFDAIERFVILVLYAAFAVRIVTAVGHDAQLTKLLVLPSEGIVLVFVLVRRRTDKLSRRPVDWLLASSAAMAPLLVRPCDGSVAPLVGAALLVVGTLVQASAKLALGRSFGCVPAHRGS